MNCTTLFIIYLLIKSFSIHRSSSDESGAIKEFETTTISKLTNEVTTISRIVEKHEEPPKIDDKKDIRKEIYRNNVYKILSNVEIRNDKTEEPRNDGPIPIMSQQSIDNVVESLTSDYSEAKKDYEVILKLPSGQQIKLIAEENTEKPKAKEVLKKVLTDKAELKSMGPIVVPSVIPLNSGTLIPVSVLSTGVVVNGGSVLPKMPLKVFDKRPVKRKGFEIKQNGVSIKHVKNKEEIDKECRKAASKRYR